MVRTYLSMFVCGAFITILFLPVLRIKYSVDKKMLMTHFKTELS